MKQRESDKGNDLKTERANEKRHLPEKECFHMAFRTDGAVLSVGELISLQHTHTHYLHINGTLAEVILFLIEVFQIIRLSCVSKRR